jgi:hypothetical protein
VFLMETSIVADEVGSRRPKSLEHIYSFPPGVESDASLMTYATPAQPVSAYHCLLPAELIAIPKSDSDQDMVTAPASVEELIAKLKFLTM